MNVEDEVDPEEERARNAAKALKELTESAGWGILKSIIEKQIVERTNKIILTPRGAQQSEYEYEFMKGEVTGMRTVLAFADSHLEAESAVSGALKDG